ncbi:MAG: rRNA maturation RNase YbeY [bacterium]
MLKIEVDGRLPSGLTVDLVQRVAASAFRQGGGKGNYQMSVSVVGDDVMRRFSRQYRGKDKTTDVLSFAYDEDGDDWPDISPGKTRTLGEIVVSLPQVRRQAKVVGRTIGDEFLIMVVHGMLHLLGYDHLTEKQENEMFGLQQEVLLKERVIYHP